MAALHLMSRGALQTPSNVSRSPPSLLSLGWSLLIQSDQKQQKTRKVRPALASQVGAHLSGGQRAQRTQRPS